MLDIVLHLSARMVSHCVGDDGKDGVARVDAKSVLESPCCEAGFLAQRTVC